MKKNNKKGITVVELIVTIALISVIMLFIFSLLSNITFESDNEYIAIVDRTTRGDMIRTINDTINSYNEEKDTPDEKIQDFELEANNKKVNIKDKNNVIYSVTIESDNKTATFKNEASGEVIQKWEMKTGTFDSISCKKAEGDDRIILLLTTCNIKVFTNNINNKELTINGNKIDNNNVLDDITFTYGIYEANDI